MIKGIDISGYQSTTYGLSLDGAVFDFVVVKATEGVSYVNPKHDAQVKRARDNGRVVGHYHFVRDGSMRAQVDYFLRHAKAQADEFLALDWEDPSVSGAEKDEFLRYLKSKAGSRKVILYCNVDYWKNRDTTSYDADGLWIAQYNNRPAAPSIEAPWLIHQYTSTPKPGVSLDVNIAKWKTRAEMAKWAGATVPAPAPATVYVDLSNVIAAAKRDPRLSQGGTTHKADVLRVERALQREGLLAAMWADGSFGTKTREAYTKWQRRCGYSGTAADGIPGKASLTKLGARHGWKVKA